MIRLMCELWRMLSRRTNKRYRRGELGAKVDSM